jgi:hypothetical protein
MSISDVQGLNLLADALAECGRAHALDPTYVKPLSCMAAVLLELRQPKYAAATLTKVLALPGLKPRDKEMFIRRLVTSRHLASLKPALTAQHFKLLNVETTVEVRPWWTTAEFGQSSCAVSQLRSKRAPVL